jgi:hypothetical protein
MTTVYDALSRDAENFSKFSQADLRFFLPLILSQCPDAEISKFDKIEVPKIIVLKLVSVFNLFFFLFFFCFCFFLFFFSPSPQG